MPINTKYLKQQLKSRRAIIYKPKLKKQIQKNGDYTANSETVVICRWLDNRSFICL